MKKGFALRGYIEGYYGRAHAPEERMRLLEFLNKVRMNAYLYAPIDDPLQRNLWQVPYPRERLREFRALNAKAQSCGVDLIMGISPDLTLRFAGRDHFKRLLYKFRQMRSIGIRSFAFCLDDIPLRITAGDKRVFKRAGVAHAALTDRLLAGLQGCRMFFCPTVYCGSFAAPSVGQSQYLADLAAMDPAIGIFWTGPRVVSEEITGRLTQDVARVLKRRVIIWDNFHANDYAPARIFLGPLTGRDGALPAQARGYLTNMTEYPRLNRLPLYTAADYAFDPCGYDAETSFQRAVRLIAPRAAAELSFIRDFFNTPFAYGPRARPVLNDLRTGRLSLKKARALHARLMKLTQVFDDRGLFNELYRFYAILLRDLQLYIMLLTAPGRDTGSFRKFYLSQRNLSSVFIDRYAARKTGAFSA